MTFWRNEEKAVKILVEHFNIVTKEFEFYDDCIRSYFENGCIVNEEIIEKVEKVHKSEHRCDTIELEFKEFLIKGGILPEVREDLLNLIDRNDKIANRIEALTDFFTLQKIQIPKMVMDEIREINDLTRKALEDMKKALQIFFKDYTKAKEFMKKVREYEHESDKHERKLIKAVFESEKDLATKMLLREFIIFVGDVSDLAENSADVLDTIVVKRSI